MQGRSCCRTAATTTCGVRGERLLSRRLRACTAVTCSSTCSVWWRMQVRCASCTPAGLCCRRSMHERVSPLCRHPRADAKGPRLRVCVCAAGKGEQAKESVAQKLWKENEEVRCTYFARVRVTRPAVTVRRHGAHRVSNTAPQGSEGLDSSHASRSVEPRRPCSVADARVQASYW